MTWYTYPLLLAVLGEVRQPVSTWLCCCKSLCAAGADLLFHRQSPLPLLGQQNRGERCVVVVLEWEMAVVTDGGKESEGEWRMAKKETQTVCFTICCEYILRLAVLSFQFNWCLAPSIQPGVKLSSREGSCTPNAVGKHTPLGQQWG